MHMQFPAGGKLRFVTDSTEIILKAELANEWVYTGQSRLAGCGFALYVNSGSGMCFYASAIPETYASMTIRHTFTLPEGEKELILYLPLCCEVQTLCLKLDGTLRQAAPYQKKPLVFYGSSITQGVGLSRPGNGYPSALGRILDRTVYNFGFAGCCKGGAVNGEIFSRIDAGIFIFDYDHNAESIAHLTATHGSFYEAYRAQRPDTPFVCMSRPDFDDDIPYSIERRAVIRKTYEDALAAGDKNIYFVDGETLFGIDGRDACTVDRVHPNDLGNYRIAKNLSIILKQIR